MTSKEYFSLAAIILGFIAISPYIWGMWRGTVKPHMFSWLIWSLVCLIGGVAQLRNGGGAGSWLLIFNSFYMVVIAIAAFKVGTRDIKRVDWVILLIALSAIPVWLLTDNALWAILIAIGIDASAYIPTFRKSWHHPEQESVASWGLSVAIFPLSILALETYNIVTCLYPVTFTFINLSLTLFLVWRRRQVGI